MSASADSVNTSQFINEVMAPFKNEKTWKETLKEIAANLSQEELDTMATLPEGHVRPYVDEYVIAVFEDQFRKAMQPYVVDEEPNAEHGEEQ